MQINNKDTHVFILMTPFHKYIAKKIIEGFDQEVKIIFLFLQANKEITLFDFNNQELISRKQLDSRKTLGNLKGNFMEKLFQLMVIMKGYLRRRNTIFHLINKYKAYFQNVKYIYLYNDLSREGQMVINAPLLKRAKLCLVEEGLASTLNDGDRLNWKGKLFNMALKILTRPKYVSQNYMGTTSNVFAYLHYSDNAFPSAPLRLKKRISIFNQQKDSKKYIHNTEICFISQPFTTDGCLSQDEYAHFLNKLAKKFPYEQIIFCVHPREDTQMYEGKLEQALKKFKLFRPSGLIEEVIEKGEIKPKTVLGITSTALYNIRVYFPIKVFLVEFDRISLKEGEKKKAKIT